MAVGTKKSNNITSFDAALTTFTQTVLGKEEGRVQVQTDSFEVVAEDVSDIGDLIKLGRFNSTARPLSIMIFSDELDRHASPTLAMDLGIYLTDDTVKDSNAFASAVTAGWGDTATTGVEYLTEANAAAVAKISKEMWEWAGEAEDPNVEYDISLKVTAAAATGSDGTISFVIMYTDT